MRQRIFKLFSQIQTIFIRVAPTQLRRLCRPFIRFLSSRRPSPVITPGNNITSAVLSQRLDLTVQASRDYINGLASSYKEDLDKSDAEGNETDRALSSQLMLITTVILTANIIVFGNIELLKSLTYFQQSFILLGLMGLITSIWLGIEYYQDIRTFHRNWADKRHEAVLALDDIRLKSEITYGQIYDETVKIFKPLDANIDERHLRRQIFILKLALIVYFAVALSFIVDFRFITGNWTWYH